MRNRRQPVLYWTFGAAILFAQRMAAESGVRHRVMCVPPTTSVPQTRFRIEPVGSATPRAALELLLDDDRDVVLTPSTSTRGSWEVRAL